MSAFVCPWWLVGVCAPVGRHLCIRVACVSLCAIVSQCLCVDRWPVKTPSPGRPGWLDPVHLPSGSLALWVRVAEAFCGLKTGSPGSALRVLGSLHPIHSRLVSGGKGSPGPGVVQVGEGAYQLGCPAAGVIGQLPGVPN